MRVILSSLIALLALGSGCGAKLADCEVIRDESPDCMPDSAFAECEASNDQCEETGSEVLVLESCPLQFACDTTSP